MICSALHNIQLRLITKISAKANCAIFISIPGGRENNVYDKRSKRRLETAHECNEGTGHRNPKEKRDDEDAGGGEFGGRRERCGLGRADSTEVSETPLIRSFRASEPFLANPCRSLGHF